MKGSQYILIAAIGILLICSCANSEKWNNIHTVKVCAEAKAEKQEKTTYDGDTFTSPSYDITVNMEFMDTTMHDNAEACHNINKYLIEEILQRKGETDGERAVASFIAHLKNEYEQEEMAPEIYDHYTGKAEYGMDGIINYTLVEDFYGGGAHPSVVTTILCFDAQTGRKIDLYDVFTDTCTQTLCDKLTERLMQQVGVKTLDSLNACGYLEMQDMFISENFLLKKDSVSFFYNQYDIAPYSFGTTTLSFSYDELEGLLRK